MYHAEILAGEDGMENISNLTLRVTPEVHQKLKIIAAIENRTMNQVVSEMVNRSRVRVPAFVTGGEKKKISRVLEKGPASDVDEVKSILTTMRESGDSFKVIADHMTAEGIPTLSGRGSWNKGTVRNLLVKWENSDTE
jgi:hypothetical protein